MKRVDHLPVESGNVASASRNSKSEWPTRSSWLTCKVSQRQGHVKLCQSFLAQDR